MKVMRDKHTRPETVLSPRNKIEGPIQVLYDGGADGYSVARIKYNGESRVAIRWNGGDEQPKGYPIDQGYPTWFTLPHTLGDIIAGIMKIRRS